MVTSAHAGPSGWEDGSERLVRLEDPEGTAAAWIAVDHGANCIGYAVRSSTGRARRGKDLRRGWRPGRIELREGSD